jgi:quinol monooxygenase YgiN
MIVRIFDTSVDPGDVERGTQLFRDDVRPAFELFPGCHGVEMLISVEEHSGDYVQIAAVSRWDSLAAIDAATQTPGYETALAEIRKLFAQTPIIRHFEAID